MTRNGKIARLPEALREELNRRLQGGAYARDLAAWLNGLPEVKRVLAGHFGGRPVNEGNISEWRTGGHVEWRARRELLAGAEKLPSDPDKMAAITKGPMADHLGRVLALRYAEVLLDWPGERTPARERKERALYALSQGVTALQRGEQRRRRQALEETRQRANGGSETKAIKANGSEWE